MANLYSVRDSDRERHIVAANSEGEAINAVEGHLKAGEYESNVDGASAQFLGTSDLVPAGTVLSGLSAADQEEAAQARTADTTTGKSTTRTSTTK